MHFLFLIFYYYICRFLPFVARFGIQFLRDTEILVIIYIFNNQLFNLLEYTHYIPHSLGYLSLRNFCSILRHLNRVLANKMERISRAEIESSVDSFPDMDYKFEHINWADIMDAEDASNPEMKLEVLKEKSCTLRSELFRSTKTQPGLPSLISLNLEDNSRGLPPLDTGLSRGVNNGTVPKLVSFSGVLKQRKVKSPVKHTSINIPEPFKIPAMPKQMTKRSLEATTPNPNTDRKSIRPSSPTSLHNTKRLKIETSYNNEWKYGDDDFIFTSDCDWRRNRTEPNRLPIPHSISVSTLESDTEIDTSSAFSDTSSTSTLTIKRSNRSEDLPIITDPRKLEQRQKQLDYGMNTEGYKNYAQLYPKFNRNPNMPRTPDKHIGYSHRRWLGLITKWRKALHKWDGINNSILAPSSKEFHLEDANIFPTLPIEEQSDTSQRTEIPMQLTYSDVLQNTHENQIIPPTPNVTSSTQDVPIDTHVPMTEETPPGPITYASILKAPVSIDTNKPDVLQCVTQQTEIVSIAKEENISDEQPQRFISTYSQALMSTGASRDVTRETNPPVENPEGDMEVDTAQKNTIQLQNNVALPTQPATYSQALRTKHLVTNTIRTEVINEQDNICKDIVPNSLTYSQVLSGKNVDTPDKNVLTNGLNEAIGLTNHATPHNTSCDPQNKVHL